MTATAAFDRLADRYDELWTTTATGAAQRGLVWRHIDTLFRPGDRVLDIGCGTGVDAAHLSGLGVQVHAMDPSPVMVQAALRRGGFTAAVGGVEELAGVQEVFDGALSNFGALNCVDDLPAAARHLAGILRPGGRLAICVLGRVCAWESLYYGCRLRFPEATRRWRGAAPSSLGITIRYPTVAQLRAAFAPYFALRRWAGIGLLAPPSYVHLPDSRVRLFGRLDRALAHLPLLRALTDHRLLILERK